VDEDKAKGKEKAKVEEYQDQVGRLESGEGSEVMWTEEIHPVTLAFEDVSFTVKQFEGIKGIKKGKNPLTRNKREILHPMSGHFVYAFSFFYFLHKRRAHDFFLVRDG